MTWLTQDGYPSTLPRETGQFIQNVRNDAAQHLDGNSLAIQHLDSLALAGNTYTTPEIQYRTDQVLVESAGRLDADQSRFFARQLELIEGQLYMVKYPDLKGRMHFPIDLTGGPSIKTITWRMFDRIGVAKFGLDFPRVDLFGKEESINVLPITSSYSYTFQEIRDAAHVNMPLDSNLAMIARRAIAETEDIAIYYGSEENGIVGAFTHPNIPIILSAFPIDYSSTPDQIIRVYNSAINQLPAFSKGQIRANSLLHSDLAQSHIATRKTSPESDTTVMEFLRKAHPGVSFDDSLRCRNASPTGREIIYPYQKSAEYMTVRIPHSFETFPPQRTLQEDTVVNCHERFAGCQFRYMNSLIMELPSATVV